MSNWSLITDSSCDLSKEKLEKYGVREVQLDVLVDGEEPHLNCDVDKKEFYKKLRNGIGAKTAAANTAAFVDVFREELDAGNDVLYLGFSSGLSTTYNSGDMAARELAEEYPERKIYTVDTLCASLGQGLLVKLVADKRKEGATIEEARDYAESIKMNICHWFTVNDLHFLKRGGRVSATVAVVGSMLNIKPIMHTDNNGKLTNVSKARGRAAAIERIAEKLGETAIEIKPDMPVFISHGDCIADAEHLAYLLLTKYGLNNIYINYVGPVIGAHSGPGTLALFYVGTCR